MHGITIVDCDGSITARPLGSRKPGGAEIFRDKVRQLRAEGKVSLIINLRMVTYVDSSGIGELVRLCADFRSCGGAVKLSNPNQKLLDLLQITKLYTLFEVFEDESDALQAFRLSSQFHYCRCPLCGLRSTPPHIEGGFWHPQKCFDCGAAFTVEASKATPLGTLLVKSVTLQGSWGEYYTLLSGTPFTIEVPPRLTLFSSHALKRIWDAIPKPRRVIFDLRHVTEIELGGLEALLTLLTEREQDLRVSVSLEGLARKLSKDFPAEPPFYQEYATARLSLGDISDTPPLFVSTSRP